MSREEVSKTHPPPDGLPEEWRDEWSVAIEETDKIGVSGVKAWSHLALERIAELEVKVRSFSALRGPLAAIVHVDMSREMVVEAALEALSILDES